MHSHAGLRGRPKATSSTTGNTFLILGNQSQKSCIVLAVIIKCYIETNKNNLLHHETTMSVCCD